MTEQMNVHKALCELKLLSKRIDKETTAFNPVIANKVCNDKIKGKSIEEWQNSVKAQYDSINTLINRRNAIKRQIALSNAKTIVKVMDKDYTVAEAIEMQKTGIELQENLYDVFSMRFAEANRDVIKGNQLAETAATEFAKNFGGKDTNITSEEIDNVRKSYYDNHKFELLDPLKSAEEIEKLRTYIDKFKAEVDSALAVSNATTIIDIEY